MGDMSWYHNEGLLQKAMKLTIQASVVTIKEGFVIDGTHLRLATLEYVNLYTFMHTHIRRWNHYGNRKRFAENTFMTWSSQLILLTRK